MMSSDLVKRAYDLSESMLADPLPRRWNHSLGVARRARQLRPVLGADSDLMEAAAILHDVGYSPPIAIEGFHPLDGARFLRLQSEIPERVIRLVAHHSCALLEAEERGLRDALQSEFPMEGPALVDALIFCDMLTTPDGKETTVDQRLNEIRERYGPDSIVARFILRATPEIRAAVSRVEHRLTTGDRP
jgi:putative nucleotidyltransferase with HDIG domain